MKQTFKWIILSIGAIYLVFRMVGSYNSTRILSDEAAFTVYLDLNNTNIDDFFKLEKGTFKKHNYSVICQLPINSDSYKTKVAPVNINLNNIDCDRPYNKDIDTKYDSKDLYGHNFTLTVIKGGFPPLLFDPGSGVARSIIVTSKDVTIDYIKGKMNNIVFRADSAYNYCSKQH